MAGGLPDSKLLEKNFGLHLDIFQERRGGELPDSKDVEDLIPALAWTFSNKHFESHKSV